MKLSKAQSSYNVYDTPQSVILNKLQNVKISEESFIRFGDKNNITNGLRALYLTKKSGYPLDKFAVNYLQILDEYDEKEKIELVIETMIQFDSRKKIDDFFKTLKPEKYVKPVEKIVDLEKAKPCLVKASLKHMNRQELRAELISLKKAPSAYFGALLEVNECKTDLFTLNQKQQFNMANKMLDQLDSDEKQKLSNNSAKNKPKQNMANSKREPKKYSVGKQKPMDFGYNDFLKPKKKAKSKAAKTANFSVKKQSATKISAKRKTAAKMTQSQAQNRIKRISDEATKIQKQGGTKTIPAKTVFKMNRADAVKKAAKTVK